MLPHASSSSKPPAAGHSTQPGLISPHFRGPGPSPLAQEVAFGRGDGKGVSTQLPHKIEEEDPDAITPAPPPDPDPDPDAQLRAKLKSPEGRQAFARVHGPSSEQLNQLHARLGGIIEASAWLEMWGVELNSEDPGDPPTLIVLTKFLRANNNNVHLAALHLKSSLVWRRRNTPLELVDAVHVRERFENLAFVTYHLQKDGKVCIVVWYLYQELTSVSNTCKNKAEFLTWWTSVMEIALRRRQISASNIFPGSEGQDVHQIVHVHDLRGLSTPDRMALIRKSVFREVAKRLKRYYPAIVSRTFITGCTPNFRRLFRLVKSFSSNRFLFRDAEIVNDSHELAKELPPLFSHYPHEFSSTPGGSSVKAGEAPYFTHPTFPMPVGKQPAPDNQVLSQQPGNQSSEATKAGPSTAGPSTAGPSTAGPSKSKAPQHPPIPSVFDSEERTLM